MAAPTDTARARYDRSKRPLLASLFAFARQTRATWDALLARTDKPGADRTALVKEAETLRKRLEPQVYAELAKLGGFDPEKGSALPRDDLDFMMHALVADYPDSVMSALRGDAKLLPEVRKEQDRLEASFAAWDRRVRGG